MDRIIRDIFSYTAHTCCCAQGGADTDTPMLPWMSRPQRTQGEANANTVAPGTTLCNATSRDDANIVL